MASDASRIHPDLLARTSEGTVVLVAELKRGNASQEPAVQRQLQCHVESVGAAFGMLVDDEHITIAPVEAGRLVWDRQVRMSTRETLEAYSEGLEPSRVEAFYLTSLVQAWLRDFALGWHSESPPGSDAIRPLGLVEGLRDAEVVTEVAA